MISFLPSFIYLDLLDVVDDEHVLQVLHRSLHPVVEGCCSLGVLQVKLIYRLQLLLCPLLDRREKEEGLIQIYFIELMTRMYEASGPGICQSLCSLQTPEKSVKHFTVSPGDGVCIWSCLYVWSLLLAVCFLQQQYK